MIGKPAELIVKLTAMLANGDTETYELKKHRVKRTLTQNAYYWTLVGKVAEAMGITNNEVHNQMIADYGYVDTDMKDIIMRDSIDWKKLDTLHVRPTAQIRVLGNGVLYRVFYVMRGSSTYNTKEMSRLVDGIIQEAQNLGIETLTPHELEQIRQAEREREKRKAG